MFSVIVYTVVSVAASVIVCVCGAGVGGGDDHHLIMPVDGSRRKQPMFSAFHTRLH